MCLDQRSLAEFFSVSRTPLREALIQLSSIGVTSMRPRRSIVVPEFSPARLLEMFEVMAEFEAMAARHAARRMSDTERSLVQRASDTFDLVRADALPRAASRNLFWRRQSNGRQGRPEVAQVH